MHRNKPSILDSSTLADFPLLIPPWKLDSLRLADNSSGTFRARNDTSTCSLSHVDLT